MARMSMKKFCFREWRWHVLKMVLPLWAFAWSLTASADEQRTLAQRLTPTNVTVQYAGNIGCVAVGAGWEYGKNKWLTEALIGYVTRYGNTQSLNTFTLRQYYTPWEVNLPVPERSKGALKFRPLSVGMFANVVLFDGDFWTKEPTHHYGGDYYRFTTRVRFAFSVGERITYEFPEEWKRWGEGVEFYYDFSTNELSVISAVPNSRLSLKDILALGVGARWKF